MQTSKNLIGSPFPEPQTFNTCLIAISLYFLSSVVIFMASLAVLMALSVKLQGVESTPTLLTIGFLTSVAISFGCLGPSITLWCVNKWAGKQRPTKRKNSDR
jgi:hypothetical protein